MHALTPATFALTPGSAVLDTRSVDAFAAGHLPGSGHLPLAELPLRRSELPPRNTSVLVVAEDGERAAAAARCLEELGYERIAWLDAPLTDVADGTSSRAPATRLWRPSPFLEAALPLLPPPADSCRVLDLAAGAGREAVFLALQGYRVEAWDHDADVLERARDLGLRHGARIDTVTRDLERRDPELPLGEHAIVTVFRFLHRPLLARVAAAVAPGGSVVYETFLRGQEQFGRPKHPRFLLDPGELPRHFPGFVIQCYEELTPPEGPWLARLLARKPA